jgi:hypothetical protein
MLAIVRHRPEATGTQAKSLRNCGARVKNCAMSALLLGSRTHAPLDDGARWNMHIHQLLYFCLRHAHPRSTRRAGLTLPDCGKWGLIKRSVALTTGDPVRTHGGSLLKLWRMNSTKQRLKQDSETICRHFRSKASNRSNGRVRETYSRLVRSRAQRKADSAIRVALSVLNLPSSSPRRSHRARCALVRGDRALNLVRV